MNKIYLFIYIASTVIISCGQNSQKELIQHKNDCFEKKIHGLKSKILYKEVLNEFSDTFRILKTQKEYFGVESYVENKIDDAVFFNNDSTKCLLAVLQKREDSLTFGTARVIYGKRINNKWQFTIDMQYSFDNNYFKIFKENNFSNIAKICRYYILIGGETKKNDCEIDDKYWFSF